MGENRKGRTGGPAARVSRRDLLRLLGGGAGLLVVHCGPVPPPRGEKSDYDWTKHTWAYAVDTTRCIGCNACMRACRAENDVPAGCFRTWVERYRVLRSGEVLVDTANADGHVFGEPEEKADVAKAFFVPKLCNHCEKSVCNQVCPVGAAYNTQDGVVLVDPKHCVGCGYCVQACPYGSRFISPRTHTAEKCTFCYHRLVRGLPPACVAACPRQARLFGDLKDPKGPLSTILSQRRYRVLKPEMGTHPKCFYVGLDREVV